MVPELQRAINVQGRALLSRFNLPDPLVEQLVASKVGQCLVSIWLDDQQLKLQSDSSLLLQVGMNPSAKSSFTKCLVCSRC